MPARRPEPFRSLSIVVSIGSLILQLCVSLFWVGGLAEKVSEMKTRIGALESSQNQTNVTVSGQQSQIAAASAKLDYIKSQVDSISNKLDSRPVK